MTLRDLSAIPVVDGERRTVGVVSRDSIMRAYRVALTELEREGSRP